MLCVTIVVVGTNTAVDKIPVDLVLQRVIFLRSDFDVIMSDAEETK